MRKQKLGHQQNHVTKNDRAEALLKKKIAQRTDLSEDTVTWMAKRMVSLADYMQYGTALIAYHKQNCDFKLRRGTLIYYDGFFHRKYDIERIKNCFIYWDIDEQGWRTFQIENFLEWKPVVN